MTMTLPLTVTLTMTMTLPLTVTLTMTMTLPLTMTVTMTVTMTMTGASYAFSTPNASIDAVCTYRAVGSCCSSSYFVSDHGPV